VRAPSEDFSGVGIEGCDERAGSVADVLELLASSFSRDGRLCRVLSSEGLHADLLVDAHDDRAVRRLLIEGADIVDLDAEAGIGAMEPGAEPMGLEVDPLQNALDGASADGPLLGMLGDEGIAQGVDGPGVAKAIAEVRGFTASRRDEHAAGDGVDSGRAPGNRTTGEALEAICEEAISPETDGTLCEVELSCDAADAGIVGVIKNDPGPLSTLCRIGPGT